jgi:ATP-dependent Clp protease adaptor protein ClpS
LTDTPTRTSPTVVVEPDVASDVRVDPLWRVILHDDDVTTMDFVVWLLVTLFRKPHAEATRLMLEVHRTGASTVATCPRERAELYVEQVHSLARPRGFPLTASAEPT